MSQSQSAIFIPISAHARTHARTQSLAQHGQKLHEISTEKLACVHLTVYLQACDGMPGYTDHKCGESDMATSATFPHCCLGPWKDAGEEA